MPQLQNLVLTDRAATPVDHTFTPEAIANGLGSVTESSGIPIGSNRVSVALNKTSTGRYKVPVKYSFPIVQTQTINGVSTPVVVRTAYADLTFTFDATSTQQERDDVVGMVRSSLDSSKTLINDTVVKLQGVY
jgi:hypothetical protein